MAFGLNKSITENQLKKYGATVEDSPYRSNNLLVNGKYEFCYTNSCFRFAGNDKILGRGKQEFLKLIQKED